MPHTFLLLGLLLAAGWFHREFLHAFSTVGTRLVRRWYEFHQARRDFQDHLDRWR